MLQVVPHITDAIQSWVERVSDIPVSADSDAKPEVCIIELGGTIGDIEGEFGFHPGKTKPMIPRAKV